MCNTTIYVRRNVKEQYDLEPLMITMMICEKKLLE